MKRAMLSLCFLVGVGAGTVGFADDSATEEKGVSIWEVDLQDDCCPDLGPWGDPLAEICELEQSPSPVPPAKASENHATLVAAHDMAPTVGYWYDAQTERYHDFALPLRGSDARDDVAVDNQPIEAEESGNHSGLAEVQTASASDKGKAANVGEFAYSDFTWEMARQAYENSVKAWEWLEIEAERVEATEATESAVDWDAQWNTYCDLQMEEAIELEFAAMMQNTLDAERRRGEVEDRVATTESPVPAKLQESIDWDAELAALLDRELTDAADVAWNAELDAERLRQMAKPTAPADSRSTDQATLLALAKSLDQLGDVLKGMSHRLNEMVIPQTAQATTNSDSTIR